MLSFNTQSRSHSGWRRQHPSALPTLLSGTTSVIWTGPRGCRFRHHLSRRTPGCCCLHPGAGPVPAARHAPPAPSPAPSPAAASAARRPMTSRCTANTQHQTGRALGASAAVPSARSRTPLSTARCTARLWRATSRGCCCGWGGPSRMERSLRLVRAAPPADKHGPEFWDALLLYCIARQ